MLLFFSNLLKGCCYKLWMMPGILASRGEEFDLGPLIRLDHSELLCNKALLKYKWDRESFWHRHQKGTESMLPCYFLARIYIPIRKLLIRERKHLKTKRAALCPSPTTCSWRQHWHKVLSWAIKQLTWILMKGRFLSKYITHHHVKNALVSWRFEINLSSGGIRCHDDTEFWKEKKKSATCSFISSCHLKTSGLPTKDINSFSPFI